MGGIPVSGAQTFSPKKTKKLSGPASQSLASITLLNALNFPLRAENTLCPFTPQTLGPSLGQRDSWGRGSSSPLPVPVRPHTPVGSHFCSPPAPALLSPRRPSTSSHPHPLYPRFRSPLFYPLGARALLPGLVSNSRASPGSAPGHVR